jgi:hypothetical protein
VRHAFPRPTARPTSRTLRSHDDRGKRASGLVREAPPRSTSAPIQVTRGGWREAERHLKATKGVCLRRRAACRNISRDGDLLGAMIRVRCPDPAIIVLRGVVRRWRRGSRARRRARSRRRRTNHKPPCRTRGSGRCEPRRTWRGVIVTHRIRGAALASSRTACCWMLIHRREVGQRSPGGARPRTPPGSGHRCHHRGHLPPRASSGVRGLAPGDPRAVRRRSGSRGRHPRGAGRRARARPCPDDGPAGPRGDPARGWNGVLAGPGGGGSASKPKGARSIPPITGQGEPDGRVV